MVTFQSLGSLQACYLNLLIMVGSRKCNKSANAAKASLAGLIDKDNPAASDNSTKIIGSVAFPRAPDPSMSTSGRPNGIDAGRFKDPELVSDFPPNSRCGARPDCADSIE